LRILCADFGSSSVKAGIIDSEGFLHESMHISYGNNSSWLKRWESALESLGGESSRHAYDAIAISSHGPTIIALKNGQPLEPVFWNDPVEHLEGEKSYFLPKCRQRPEADLFLGFPEYLYWLLGADPCAISPSEEFSPYIWTDREIQASGFNKEQFPPFVDISEDLGYVSETGSKKFHFRPQAKLFAAGSDFLMSLIGTNALKPGTTCDRAGTSEGINHCVDRRILDDRLRLLPHVKGGLYNLAGILSSSGSVFEWFRRISGYKGRDYKTMLQSITSLGLHADRPYFFPSVRRGPVWEFKGGMFSHLEPSQGREEMGRAVVEAIGYGIRDVVEDLGRVGEEVTELRVTGGQGRNTPWNQLKADIAGVPVVIPRIKDGELLGSACSAFKGLKIFSSIEEAADELFVLEEVFQPDTLRRSYYNQAYSTYCEYREKILAAGPVLRPS
jgi:xylulokinase